MKLPAMHSLSRGLLTLSFALAAIPQNSLFAQELQLQNLRGVRGGNLVVVVTSDHSNFSRMLTSGSANTTITERLLADLVHINRSDFKLEPFLATRWGVDKTGRIYTIHLRPGVRFSNNSLFTADDVVFSFQVLTDSNIQCDMAGQIETDGTFPTISKIDDYAVRLTFRRAEEESR